MSAPHWTDDLTTSERPKKCIRHSGIKGPRELKVILETDPSSLLRIKNFGKGSLKELSDVFSGPERDWFWSTYVGKKYRRIGLDKSVDDAWERNR